MSNDPSQPDLAFESGSQPAQPAVPPPAVKPAASAGSDKLPTSAQPSSIGGPTQPFSYSFADESSAQPAITGEKTGTQPMAPATAQAGAQAGAKGIGATGSTQGVRSGSQHLGSGSQPMPAGSQRMPAGSQRMPAGAAQASGRTSALAAADGGGGRGPGTGQIVLGSMEPLDNEDDDEPPPAPSALRGGIPTASIGLLMSWGLSLAVHGSLLGVAGALLSSGPIKGDDVEIPPTRVVPIPPHEAPPPPPPPPVVEQAKTEVEVVKQEEPTTQQTPPTPTEVVEPVAEAAPELEQTKQGSGREEAAGSVETGGDSTTIALGAGGGGSGAYGLRTVQGRSQAVKKFGGSNGSERAVDSALRWFKIHQGADGRWDPVTYLNNCTQSAKCEPGQYDKETGAKGTTIATSSYVLLCYLGAGYDHKSGNTYRTTVRKGVEWLIQQQSPDGVLGKRNYEHAIATMALAEAFALSGDTNLKRPTERALQVIIQRQNRDAKGALLGWSYENAEDRNDASVTGWCIMALKSAIAGGFSSASAPFQASKVWLDRHWQISNQPKEASPEWKSAKEIGSFDKSRFAYTWRHSANTIEMEPVATAHGGQHSLECVGLVTGVFFGKDPSSPMMSSLANTVLAHQVPTRYPCNTYYMYYNTLALFQMGGDQWTQWNERVRDLLVASQRKGGGCFDGSWDANDTVFWGQQVGRILHTAYSTLSLEVYYRYARVAH